MALIYLVFILAIFYWQLKRVRTGRCGKVKAVLVYYGYGLMPALLYVLVFMGVVGIEQMFETAIISDLYARALPFVLLGSIVAAVVTGLLFALVVALIKPKPSPE